MSNIKLSDEVIIAVNNQLEEDFLSSIEVTPNREVIVRTVEYGDVRYSYEKFFGEPVGSAHDLIKYEVYNKYLVDMNEQGKELYELLKK